MAKQGEAYVEIRADFDKFGKDLDRGLKTAVTKFERELNKDLGKRIGGQVGAGAKEGLESSLSDLGKTLDDKITSQTRTRVRDSGKRSGRQFGEGVRDGLSELGPIRKGLSNLVSALEDGFSSLPAEIKAIVGGALLIALVPLGAFIGGAVAAATVAAFATIGSVLAYQFEEVQSDAKKFVTDLRTRFVNAAAVFILPVQKAFDIWDYRLNLLEPTIESVFGRSAAYVEPLATAISNLAENVLRGLDRGLAALNTVHLSDTLINGFTDLGEAVGNLFDNILSNDDTVAALDDLFSLLVGGVIAVDKIINALLDLWGAFKIGVHIGGEIIETFSAVLDLLDGVLRFDPDKIKDSWKRLNEQVDWGTGSIADNADEHVRLTKAIGGTIVATKDETKAVEELNKQLVAQDKLINDLITTNVDYQESIDDTNTALGKTHGTLNADKEAGRTNITNIQARINKLKELVETQVATGEMTEAQARTYYQNELTRLHNEFTARGGNLKQFEQIFGALEKLNTLPPAPDKFGPFKLSLAQTLTLINAVLTASNALANVPKPRKYTPGKNYGPQKYADGGRITEPTFAMMGEGYRPELVLPESQPLRSAQILANSPLGGILGGGTNVAVYIGDEQLDARMYRVAKSVSAATSRTLSQKPRNI